MNDPKLPDLLDGRVLQRMLSFVPLQHRLDLAITDRRGLPLTESVLDETACRLLVRTATESASPDEPLRLSAPIRVFDQTCGYLVGQEKASLSLSQPQRHEALGNFLQFRDALSEIAQSKGSLLQAQEQMVQAAEMKSNFLSNMSHEIRTPMSAVLGMTDLALREDLSPAVREYLNQIKSSGHALLDVINQVLDLSRIESDKMEITPVEYAPAEMIHDIVAAVSPHVDTQEVELLLDISPQLPDRLRGDGLHIRQVVLNLLSNAAKFTHQGKIVLKVDASAGDETHCRIDISVRDTGIGIKDEELQTVFDSFYQVDSSRRRANEGAGLGLAICRALVKLMGGTLRVKSEYNVGSEFYFSVLQQYARSEDRLKVEAPAPTARCAVSAEDYGGAALEKEEAVIDFQAPDAKVLIVDDNQVNITVETGLLQLLGVQVQAALSGMDAIAKMKRQRFDLIFMDHMMPELDGVETTQIIRSMMPEYDAVPIVALTADVFEEAQALYTEAGMNDFLPKPVEMTQMMKMVKRWLPPQKVMPADKAMPVSDAPVQQDAQQAEPSIVIPGFNTAQAIKMLGSEALYTAVVKEYYTQIDAKAEEIRQAYNAEDWPLYTILVHALKSASRQIGDQSLAGQAEALEKAGKSDDIDTIRADTAPLLESFARQKERLADFCEQM